MIPGSKVLKIDTLVQRRLNSCSSCRSRKRKCDKAKPECRQCVVHGRKCIYYEKPTGSSDLISSRTTDLRKKDSVRSIGTECDVNSKTSRDLNSAFWPFSQTVHVPTKCARKGPIFTSIMSNSLFQTAERPESSYETLKEYMPQREEAKKLICQYELSVHPIIPILDVSQLWPCCSAFYEGPAEMNISFYILMFSVFYAGSVSLYEEASIEGMESTEKEGLVHQMREYVSATEMALAMANFPRAASVVGLQGAVILHSICRNDCKVDDSASIAMLVRVGHLLELHRDPGNFHGIKDDNDIQRRRLLWWQLIYLDGLTSLSSGLLPVTIPEEHDTLRPQETDLETGIMDEAIVFSNAKFCWIEVCNRIMRTFYGIKMPTSADIGAMDRLLENLECFCEQQITKLRTHHSQFTDIATSIASTFTDRCYLLFHKKLSENTFVSVEDGLESRSSQKVAESSSLGGAVSGTISEKSVKCALHFLSEFCFYGKMPDNKRFIWELRKFQPLQAILSLLRSLIYDGERLCSLHPDTQFHRRFFLPVDERVVTIEKAIEDLGYLSKHTTRLCSERWELVRQLKSKAFKLLSLNDFPSPENSLGWDIYESDKATASSKEGSDKGHSDDYWTFLESEIKDIRNSLEEVISVRIWDQDSGHFLQ